MSAISSEVTRSGRPAGVADLERVPFEHDGAI
jgi:hypothetical protein